jgi:hypothetical protein
MSKKATAVGAAKSKLVWLGLAVLVMGQVQTQMDVLSPFVPEKWIGLANSLLGIAIMVARFFTTESLTEKGTSNETQ